jgi:hypothetical protein
VWIAWPNALVSRALTGLFGSVLIQRPSATAATGVFAWSCWDARTVTIAEELATLAVLALSSLHVNDWGTVGAQLFPNKAFSTRTWPLHPK